MKNRNLKSGPPAMIPCPNCRKLLNPQANQCLYCGYRFPGLVYSLPFLKELLREQIHFVDGILIACFVLYALAIALDLPAAMQFGGGIFNMFSPSNQALLKLGMGGYIPLSQGWWWTLLTATYLHGSVLHILFNMLWLRQLGPLVDELFGPSRFLIIYTGAGVGGALLSAVVGKTPFFVGASGAVFGLMGALIVYGLQRRGMFGTAIFRQMLLWAVIGLALGFTRSDVDNLGHVGGLAVGALLALVLGFQEKKRQQVSHHLLALVTLAFIVICFILMVINFFRL